MPKPKKARPKKQAGATQPKSGAVVDLAAKAIYKRSRTTSEIIPPDVTRAKAGAWLDLISPITEWAGLKGDELRHRRSMLRLQREDTLTKIVQEATKQISSEPFGTIPVKFLVPFLEQASLEDPSSPLVSLWANLLAAAATAFSPQYVHFSSIMGQISSKQAELFRDLVGVSDLRDLEFARDRATVDFSAKYVDRHVRHSLASNSTTTLDLTLDTISSLFDSPGIEVIHIGVFQGDDYYEPDTSYSHFSDAVEADYEILEAVGLIRRVELDTSTNDLDLHASYYLMTPLGYHFAAACKVFVTSESIPGA